MTTTRLARIVTAATVAVGVALPMIGASAFAATPSVTKTGHCSITSSYSLQLQRESAGQLSVDWGVDMRRHVAGVTWNVSESANTLVFVHRSIKTVADGSISITRVVRSKTPTVVIATATNPATGETCTASAAL